ncbi:MAG TPA: phosphoribosylformylglycinamidine synthase subunit PurS [Brumimicrobium sp.]|nr:phosphoribosylformylglycinamidine synthase subunit PurS [Brumimicrobium sp.]
MKFKAEIDIMQQDALLDPQGKAVSLSMKTIGLPEITDVRVGRHIQLFVEAEDKSTATAKIEEACKKLLVNQVMEQYTFTIEEVG